MLPMQGGGGVRLSCWRMAAQDAVDVGLVSLSSSLYHGETDPSKRYRLLGKEKKDSFEDWENEQPDLTRMWCLELTIYWKELKEIKREGGSW